MANKIASAALQYSKRLSKFICWAWTTYRFTVIILAAITPAVAEALVSTIPGIDTIMMINISCYLCNSLGEKIIYSDRFIMKWLDKEGFKHLLAPILKKKASEEVEEEEEEENPNG